MKKYLPFFALPVLIIFLTRNNPFFWDTTYHSILAQWFYDKGPGNFILPLNMDAGHPPFFAYYISLIWKIFGKSLAVSHFAILPFALGIYWQLFRFVKTFIEEKHRDICLLLLAFEPTLLAQCSMPSYELALVFFYLLAINSITKKENLFLTLALCGMVLTGTRGIISVPAVFITSVFLNYGPLIYFEKKENLFRFIFPFLISGIVAFAWVAWHYSNTQWFFFTPSQTYNTQRNLEDLSGVLRNVVIIGWRCIDFGRLGIWLALVLCLPILLKKKLFNDKKFLQLGIICFAPLIILSISFIPFSNPIGHRYYLVFYLLFIVFAYYVIIKCAEGIKRTLLIILSLLMLLTGHLWKYPKGISMGWDSTLAHLPWFGLRDAMINYLDQVNIPFDRVGTNFPNKNSTSETNLSNDHRNFAEADMKKDPFIMQSNIMNNFSTYQIDELEHKWILIKEFKKAGLYIRLYQKPSK